MNKKRYLWLAVAVLAVLLAGCGKSGTEVSGYKVYYTNQARTKLITESYTSQKTDATEILGDLFQRMNAPLTPAEHEPLMPEGVEITEYTLTDGQLTVTFNDNYLRMDNVTEILLRAGLVNTAAQVEGVRTVVIHIGDGILCDSAGEPVGAMTAGMFINNPVGINSYQYASLPLYFANKDGTKLVREVRNVHYSSNTTLEKVVIEQLLKGPTNQQLQQTLPQGLRVLDATVESGMCTLNLNEEFISGKTAEGVLPEVTIYSIVNSLCDALGTERVQFRVEGDSEIIYREQLNLSGPFHRNSELIEVISDVPAQTDAELQKPSIGL